MHLLIIGGGVCGTSAAEELRKISSDAEITIISNENHPLYSRVLLPNYILGKAPRERMFLKKPEWHEEKNIKFVHDEVTALDPKNKSVTTQSGATFTYDNLLIAGGGITNRLSFSDHKNVLHFQTIEDADNIIKVCEDRKGKQTVARIVGGGFIATEFYEIFPHYGFETHVHLREDRFFERSFDLEMSKILEDHLEKNGIKVHCKDGVTDFDGSAIKSSKSMPCDILGVGVGLSSRFPWVIEAGVKVNQGIVTNEFLETNLKNIYAAGNCVEYKDIVTDRTYKIGNWMNATMQGRNVARTLTGDRAPFRLVTSYASKIYGMDVISVGDAVADEADETIIRENKEGRTRIFLRNKRAVGASIINRTADRNPITKLIDQQIDLSDSLDKLSDPNYDLKELTK